MICGHFYALLNLIIFSFYLGWHFSSKLPSTPLFFIPIFLTLHTLPFDNHQFVPYIYGSGMFKFRKLTFLYWKMTEKAAARQKSRPRKEELWHVQNNKSNPEKLSREGPMLSTVWRV